MSLAMAQRSLKIGTSIMPLYITCIKSEGQFLKFWMLSHSDLEKLKAVENNLTENSAAFEASSRMIRNLIIPGFQCVVKSKVRKCLCRARVIGMTTGSYVFVRLIDYGNDETVPVSDLAKIEDQTLAFFPDLATECALADVVPYGSQWPSEILKYCEDSLIFKALNGSVISYYGSIPVIRIAIIGENSPFVQRLINGNHARIGDPSRNNYKSVILSQNIPYLVQVSYVESHIFYVQLVSAELELKNLMDAIKSWSEVEHQVRIHSAMEGTPCLARVEHKSCYYRVVITAVVQSKCQVRFVDYGYSEIKELSELYVIPPMFLNAPAQAIACSFPNDTKLSKDDLIEATRNKHLTCHVIGQVNDVYNVKLLHGDQDMFLPQPRVPIVRRSELQGSLVYRKDKLGQGTVEVTVSALNDFDDFYCQLTLKKEQQVTIASLLNSGYEFLTLTPSELQPMLPVCVKFTEDKRWYRGEIVKIFSEREIEIFFVDFGNREMAQLSDLRRINSSCLQFPVQAYKCSLTNAQSLLSSAARDSIFDVFEEHAIGRNLVAAIKDCVNETYLVELHDKNSSQSINEKLMSKAITVESVSVSPVENLFITSFQSPNLFFAQFEKLDQAKLAEMQDEIDSFFFNAQNVNFRPSVGDLVCAKFAEDGRFYRAKIEACKGNTYAVFFIDYGNQEVVPLQDIHPMNAKFARFPVFGISCGLEKFSEKVPVDSLKSLMLDNSIQANMIKRDTKRWLISLTENFSSNAPILEFLRQHDIPSPIFNLGSVSIGNDRFSTMNPRMPNSIPDSMITNQQHDYEENVITLKAVRNVFISHVNSPSEFYCQIEEESKKLEELMKNIADTYENLNQNSLKFKKFLIGSPCCAKFQEDQVWYRGKIKATNLRSDSQSCDVFFVDYGNIDAVPSSDVRVLDPKFFSLPPQALKCSSYNLPPPTNGVWTDEDVDAFYDMFCNKSFVAQFIEISDNDSHVVNLVNLGKLENESLSKEFLNSRQKKSPNFNEVKQVADLKPHAVSKASAFADMSNTGKLKNDSISTEFHNSRKYESQNFNQVKQVVEQKPHIVSNASAFADIAVRIGSSEGVEVTWILNQCEFYCQLKSSATDFKNMMANMQSHYNTFPETRCAIGMLRPGMIAVAQFSQDSAWYRVEIEKVERNDVVVSYIDYGNSETTSKNKIRSVCEDFADLPRHSIKCHMNGISRFENCLFTPQLAQKYFDGDLKCKFIAKEGKHFVVDMLCNNASVAQRMINDGVVIDKNAPTKTASSFATTQAKSDNFATQQKQYDLSSYPAQKLSFVSGELLEVIVSFVENPGKFWCQKQDESEILEQLMASIEEHYSTTVSSAGTSILKAGSACIAKYSADGAWYRAVVQSCPTPKEYEVMFVDYGNSEVIQSSEVCAILPEFSELAPQAFQCKLHSIPPSISRKTEAVKLFQSLVDEAEELTAKVEASSKEFITMTLFYDKEDEQVNISDTLLQTFESDINGADDFNHFKPPNVPSGSHEGYVSIVFNPDLFYVQLASCEAALATLTSSLIEKCEGQKLIEDPRVGLACCAKYSEDQSWYRAEIISVGETTASVSFVDYGNTEDVPLTSLKSLEENLLSVPPYAIKCRLNGIFPNGDNWSDDSITGFEEAVSDASLQISFITNDLPAAVNISKNGEDVSKTLLDKKLACLVSTTPAKDLNLSKYPDGSLPSNFIGKINFVTSFDKFYVMPLNWSADLDTVTNRLEETYGTAAESDFALSAPESTMPCAAKYAEDGAWYRAVITDVKGDEISIRFVDYGNSELTTVENLKSLTSELIQLPALTVEGSFVGIQPAHGKETEVKAKLDELCVNEIEVEVELCSQKPIMVKLKSTSELVNTLVEEGLVTISACETENALKTFPERHFSSKFAAKISFVDSFDKFYVTAVDSYADLDTVTYKLEDQYTSATESEYVLSDPKPSMPCAAKYSEDEAWYRAVIIDVKGDEISVIFVDYGNSEVTTVNALKSLTPDLMEIPPVAIEGSLMGMKSNDEKQTEIKATLEQICTDEVEIEVEVCNTIPKTVKLIQNSELVNSMISNGLVVISSDEVLTPSQLLDADENFADSKTFPKYTYPSNLTGKIIYVNSFDEFFIMPVELSTELDNITTLLEATYSSATEDKFALTDPKPLLLCAAKYNEDGAWYRAVIIDVKDEGVLVRFVDYGNSEVIPIEDLRLLTDELIQTPAIAIECSLFGMQVLDGKEPEIKSKLDDLCANEEELEVEACEVKPNTLKLKRDTDFVNLLLSEGLVELSDKQLDFHIDNENLEDAHPKEFPVTETNEKENMINLSETSTSDRLPDHNYPSSFTAKVSHVESFDKFFVMSLDLSLSLETITSTLDTVYGSTTESDSVLSDPKPSMLCAAKYSEDELWYRAVINDVIEEEIFVSFVDYGNSDVTTSTNVKILHPELIKVPAIAIECSLLGMRPIEGKESEVKDKLEFLFVNETEIEVELCDEMPKMVKLKLDSDFVTSLVNEGLVELSEKQFERLNNNEAFKENLKIAFVDEPHDDIPQTMTADEDLQEHTEKELCDNNAQLCEESNASLGDEELELLNNMSDDQKSRQLESHENVEDQLSIQPESKEAETAVEETDKEDSSVQKEESINKNQDEETDNVVKAFEMNVEKHFEEVFQSKEKIQCRKQDNVNEHEIDVDAGSHLSGKKLSEVEKQAMDTLSGKESDEDNSKVTGINPVSSEENFNQDNLGETEKTTNIVSETEIESDTSKVTDLDQLSEDLATKSEETKERKVVNADDKNNHSLVEHENYDTEEQQSLEDLNSNESTQEFLTDSRREQLLKNIGNIPSGQESTQSLSNNVNQNEVDEAENQNEVDESKNQNEVIEDPIENTKDSIENTEDSIENTEDLRNHTSCAKTITLSNDSVNEAELPFEKFYEKETTAQEENYLNVCNGNDNFHSSHKDTDEEFCEDSKATNIDVTPSGRQLYDKQKIKVSEIMILEQVITFSVTPLDDLSELETLQSSLQDIYSRKSEPLQCITTMEIYAVKSATDNIWYRAKILEETGNNLTVLYIDNGRSETIQNATVQELSDELKNSPPFGIWCTLVSATCCAPQEEVKNNMINLMADADVAIAVIDAGEPYRADLLLNNQSILRHLVSKNLIVQNLVRSYMVSDDYIAKISHASLKSDCLKIYVNLDVQLVNFNKLKEDMQNSYELSDEHIPLFNTCFYAVYHHNLWFRCLVTTHEDSLVQARLVDTGESVETRLNLLRPLLPRHYLHPAYALVCSLPVFEILVENFVEKFTEVVEAHHFMVRFVDDDPSDGQWHATLLPEVFDRLIEANLISFNDTSKITDLSACKFDDVNSTTQSFESQATSGDSSEISTIMST